MGLLGELLKLCSMCEERISCCADVDVHVVSRMGWHSDTIGRVAEQSETCEEAVDSLTEGHSELPSRREAEEVVDVR
jgi:hypothetical protein